MSSVRKRALRSGKARWVVDFVDPAGNRRNKNFERKKDADAYLDQVKAQIRAGTLVMDDQTVTVRAACETYLESGSVKALEPSTWSQYDQHVRVHIVPRIGDIPSLSPQSSAFPPVSRAYPKPPSGPPGWGLFFRPAPPGRPGPISA